MFEWNMVTDQQVANVTPRLYASYDGEFVGVKTRR